MLNKKKMELSYKRYCKNFIDGINFDNVKEEYEESKSEIYNIVQLNEIEKDHILLVDLDSISAYYFSKWKEEVLINGNRSPKELQQVQKTIFYQCMSQYIYRVKYPSMMVEYSFEEVITTLIHFAMYGWVKEEDILFKFIVNHLGNNIMEANDWHKHIWFLLELYLQHTEQTMIGTNQNVHLMVRLKLIENNLSYDLIPEELGVYKEVLERWDTTDLDEITQLIAKMIEYHSILATYLGESLEFGDFRYAFYPYEILYLLHVRKKQGLPNPEHFDDFLMNTPEAKMVIQDPETYPEWDPMLRLIDDFYRKNYPEYIPNQHGDLF